MTKLKSPNETFWEFSNTVDYDAFVNFSVDFVILVLLFRTEFVWREMSNAL